MRWSSCAGAHEQTSTNNCIITSPLADSKISAPCIFGAHTWTAAPSLPEIRFTLYHIRIPDNLAIKNIQNHSRNTF
jgi:hypothetical protein